MSKKNVEFLNEFSGRLLIFFFCFLKQEVVRSMGKHSLPKRPQFGVK